MCIFFRRICSRATTLPADILLKYQLAADILLNDQLAADILLKYQLVLNITLIQSNCSYFKQLSSDFN